MARAKYEQSIVASVSNAADATTRGAIDVRERDGGLITIKMTNGATGPTVPCRARIMVAHTTGATPATAAAGADWKTVEIMIGATTNNAVIERKYDFGPAVKHVQVEFTANTVQAVTVEAIASTFSYSA
jgi:hypothetical protein